jgi:hypothetical protein
VSSATKLRAYHEVILDHLTGDHDEAVTTGRWVRPYEGVEIRPQRALAHTVARRRPEDSFATWFATTDTKLGAIEDPEVAPKQSWWWLVLTLAFAVGAALTLYLMM